MHFAGDTEVLVGVLFAYDQAGDECVITLDLARVDTGNWRATVARLAYPHAEKPDESLGEAAGTTFLVEALPGARGRT